MELLTKWDESEICITIFQIHVDKKELYKPEVFFTYVFDISHFGLKNSML